MTDESFADITPNRGSPEEYARVLRYVTAEVDRNVDSARRLGFSAWSVLVALVAILVLLSDNIWNSVLAEGRLTELLFGIVCVANLFVIASSVVSYVGIVRQWKRPQRLMCGITALQTRQQINRIHVLGLLVIALDCGLLVCPSDSIAEKGLLLGSASWIGLRICLSQIFLHSRRSFLNLVGSLSPDYTLLMPAGKQATRVTAIVFSVLELANVILLIYFFLYNADLYTPYPLKELGPIVAMFIAFLFLLVLLSLFISHRRVVNVLRTLEFVLVKAGQDIDNPIWLVEETMWPLSIGEWLFRRNDELWRRSSTYFVAANQAIQSAQIVLDKESFDIASDFGAVSNLLLIREIMQNPLIGYLAGCHYHLRKIEQYRCRTFDEAHHLGLLQASMDALGPLVLEKSQKVNDLLLELKPLTEQTR